MHTQRLTPDKRSALRSLRFATVLGPCALASLVRTRAILEDDKRTPHRASDKLTLRANFVYPSSLCETPPEKRGFS